LHLVTGRYKYTNGGNNLNYIKKYVLFLVSKNPVASDDRRRSSFRQQGRPNYSRGQGFAPTQDPNYNQALRQYNQDRLGMVIA